MGNKKLPIGIENFEEIRTQGFYYVDKTGLFQELLDNWGKVNLFTRPRRFGKSLNMSMLKYFFEYGCDPGLFEGLTVSREQELCAGYMGKYPVISITLKGVDGHDFPSARAAMCNVIGDEALRFQFLLESDKLGETEKLLYKQLIEVDSTNQTTYAMPDSALEYSLKRLSQLLYKHYGQKVIVLIDEYDVPLDKACQGGYYDRMVGLIRNIFGNVLKSNESLQFAVLTGCLRVSKESIFTGLNNMRVYSIADVQFDEYFGFTDAEVRELLSFYGLTDHYATMKEWYDGYRFGNVDVYCPWDVVNYAASLRADPTAQPQAFWVNSSGNDIVRSFLRKANTVTVKQEIERLAAGETVQREIRMDLTYKDMDKSLENLWSVLFTTGYLTQSGMNGRNTYNLRIPNLEIREIFVKQIYSWFEENAVKDGTRLNHFCDALQSGDAVGVEEQFNAYLGRTISIRDTFIRRTLKENFYHGILLGLVSYRENWGVSSNKESGDGYSNILIEIPDRELAIIIEVKYPDNGDLETGCQKALAQIETLHYDGPLRDNGALTILKYGIACGKKRCKVALSES